MGSLGSLCIALRVPEADAEFLKVNANKVGDEVPERKAWLSTREAASQLGMTSTWVRRQISEKRLVARYFATGARRVYRIHWRDLRSFEREYLRESGPVAPR